MSKATFPLLLHRRLYHTVQLLNGGLYQQLYLKKEHEISSQTSHQKYKKRTTIILTLTQFYFISGLARMTEFVLLLIELH